MNKRDVLQRLSDANLARPSGPGLQEDQAILLCQMHNRSLANMLVSRLDARGVAVESSVTRMYTSISVAFEDRAVAFEILGEFRQSHPDTEPKRFSRDFDFVILVGICTATAAAGCFFSRLAHGRYVALAILVTGASICVVLEYLNRHYRNYVGKHLSLAAIFVLTTLVALVIAVWRSLLSSIPL